MRSSIVFLTLVASAFAAPWKKSDFIPRAVEVAENKAPNTIVAPVKAVAPVDVADAVSQKDVFTREEKLNGVANVPAKVEAPVDAAAGAVAQVDAPVKAAAANVNADYDNIANHAVSGNKVIARGDVLNGVANVPAVVKAPVDAAAGVAAQVAAPVDVAAANVNANYDNIANGALSNDAIVV